MGKPNAGGANGTNEASTLVKTLGVETKVKVFSQPRDDVKTEENPTVDFNALPIQWLTNGIAEAIDRTSYREVVPAFGEEELNGKYLTVTDQLELGCKAILGARLLDLNDKKCGVGRANVEYPSLIAPFIAAYGKVDRPEIGLLIKPVPSMKLMDELIEVGVIVMQDKECNSEDIFNEIQEKHPEMDVDEVESKTVLKMLEHVRCYTCPEWYQKLMLWLRRNKLMTNFGMPKDKFIADEGIYKITTEDTALIGVAPVISADTMLIATIVRAAALANVYGQYRVGYGFITGVRSAIEDIALKAIHLERNEV